LTPPNHALDVRRTLRYLRIAVTSRCNLRCIYCRPPKGPAPGEPEGTEGQDLLTRDEIVRFVRLAVECGIHKVRVTGGEPLLRDDILDLVRDLAATPGLSDLGLTTNGTLLAPLAPKLRAAGLRRINIGLSALTPEVYHRVTRVGSAEDALAGLGAALDAGFDPVKVNVVVMRGVNDGEIAALAALTRDAPTQVRFVEYMPFRTSEPPETSGLADAAGGAQAARVVAAEEILARLRQLGDLSPLPARRGAAASRCYRIAGHKGTVGVIAPHSAPFCHACNRVRLTADGRLRSCLIEGGEQDILPLLRRGMDRETMQRLLAAAAAAKPARHHGSFRGRMHQIGG